MKKIIMWTAAILVALLVIFFGTIYVLEYKPEAVEKLEITKGDTLDSVNIAEEYKMLTFNVGYSGLNKTEDFFLDGGVNAMPETREEVEANIAGIKQIITKEEADFTLLQEVDMDSKRTYYTNQYEIFKDASKDSVFATFLDSKFTPYPLKNMLGKTKAGMAIYSRFALHNATRIDLPSAYSFPVRAFQTKRALQRQEVAVAGTDKKLVIYNVHLEAYDTNNTREKQLQILSDKIEEDYANGNYVIVGGDFNQRFPDADHEKYKAKDEKFFHAPIMHKDAITENFSFIYSDKAPTARSLDKPYTGNREDIQLYVIDGYIFSKNIEVTEVDVKDYDFAFSDHNPVTVHFKLLEDSVGK